MGWVYAAIATGLLGILLEILHTYQKRSDELAGEEERLRSSLAKHRQAVEELQAGSERTAASIEELKAEKKRVSGDLGWRRQELEELQRRASLRGFGRHRVDDSGHSDALAGL